MATMRLIPSTLYNAAGTSYLTVTSQDNMMTNTDSTTYGTVTNINASTSSRYVYLRGFNFSSLPSDAIVSSFTIKLKANESNISTSSNYRPRICNGTTTLTGSSSTIGTSASVITFTGVTADWDTIKSYGANFGIRINVRRSNSNTQGYVNIYGAEISVTYTVPVYHSVSVTGSNVSPSGTTSVLEGDSLLVKCYDSTKPTVTDNNVDVTSQLVQGTESGGSYSVTNITTTYGFALNANDYYESNNKAHASSAAVCRVDISVPVAATVTFSLINYAEATYDYGLLSNIDTTLNTNASADTTNVYWNGKNNNSASVQTVTYSNVTAGDHYIYVKYFKDSYTDQYNDSLQFKVAITLTEPYTPQTYWGYTLTNITADHTIVVTAGGSSTQTIYYKDNGSWVAATAVYKKVRGSWVLQQDLSTVFDSQTNYVKG